MFFIADTNILAILKPQLKDITLHFLYVGHINKWNILEGTNE